MTLLEALESRARETSEAVAADADRLASLLKERDALLAELTTALGTMSAAEAPALTAALEGASRSTAALITEVAERTDALRRELRTLGRGTVATQAYLPPDAARGQLNARR